MGDRPSADDATHAAPRPSPLRRAVRFSLRWTWRIAVALVAAGLFLGCCVFSSPRHSGPPSDHFDGSRFFNPESARQDGLLAFLKWRMDRDLGPWDTWTASPPGPAPSAQVRDGGLRVTFVNHATTLVQMDGLNFLTDPVWSARASPVPFAGPKRRRAPGLRFEELPRIDAVLVSHNHYDALDEATLARLAEEHGAPILVGLGNTALLEREGIPGGVDLDWWDAFDVNEHVRITVVPVRHFSGRGLLDRDASLWCGFVIEGPSGRVYFGGDTGYGEHFALVRERLGPPRLALLAIGAYRPRWFMSPVHMDPAQAVQAHRDLGAGTSVGIHFGTFPLADDGQHEPVAALEQALDAVAGERPRFRALDHGESLDVP